MEIILRGAAREVGRSCAQLISKEDNIIFDCGIKLGSEVSEYPSNFDQEKVNAVFLSHAHLDHSGALPLFNYKGLQSPIFTNNMTKALSKILMKDSLHIELLNEQHPAYSKENIYNVMDLMKDVKYGINYKYKDISYKFFDAGHIPGSASIKVKIDGKSVVYTGDFNTNTTKLLKGAKCNFGKTDVLITEATYGDRPHPNRKLEEQHFLDTVQETIEKGASVLIPAFAVGRSQEVLLMLQKLKTKVPIYLDGMSKKVTKTFFEKPEYVTNVDNLHNAYKKVEFVRGIKDRATIMKNQGIFVTTSGMLDGGPIMDYLKHFYFDKDIALLLTGYQAEDTNGRLLIEKGQVFIDGNKVKIKCNVNKYDFSAHVGLNGIQDTISKIKPKHLILNHGDESSIQKLTEWTEENHKNINVHPAKVDEIIKV